MNAPQKVLDKIRDQAKCCPFVHKGQAGCALHFRPDLTELDGTERNWHATCGKHWYELHSDPHDTQERIAEIVECSFHPIFDDAGNQVAGDWS